MRNLNQLQLRGQSPWYDNLSRGLIESGQLQSLIDRGIVGLTSNPTIFDNAISQSDEYTSALRECKAKKYNAEQTYWDLVCDDIAETADLLKDTYEKTNHRDGFVSVEVSPLLAHKTAETIAQANELYARISRDNVMIKIPATIEGLAAIEAVVANSIPVNVTLIFSQERYKQVVQAYMDGASKAEKTPQSVASFFISRLDTMVDSYLDDNSPFMGKAAIANAGIVYSIFDSYFGSDTEKGQAQRPLWASTSTKNPSYSPTLYVDELISKHTVNTMPHITIDAFEACENILPETDLIDNLQSHNQTWEALEGLVPIDTILKELEQVGVSSFEKSYLSCLNSIESRLAEL